MPTYAILGATGETGSAVLRHLAASHKPDLTRNLLVRSKQKLLSLHPSVSDNPNIVIFEGAIDNPLVLAQCLRGANSIFSCVGVNESEPDMSIALDTAKGIVSALQLLQEENPTGYRAPTVVMLSSVAVSPIISTNASPLFNKILHTALSHLYEDLERAESYYKMLAHDQLFNFVFAQPPAIMAGDVPTGHELSTTRSAPVVSYADLGAGMVEMVERGDEFWGKGVCVNATGEVREDWSPHIKTMLVGLVAHFFPGAWWFGRRQGWW